MTDQPLTPEELEELRDGNAGPEPCHDCGCQPIHRDGMTHFFHAKDCSVPEAVRRLVDEG